MKVLILSILLSLSGLLNAQNNLYNQVSIASPTAASLAKYSDIPVNYHSGTPSINIPLHNVQEGNISLPISLSYFAGGLKVMEASSWVGTGFSLNAGGVITRSVRGTPDERYTSTVYDQTKGYFSDYGFRNYAANTSGISFSGQAFFAGTKDGQPDLFFFNFNGYSGKFYFNDDRTPVLVSPQDLKIEYNYQEGVGSIKSFIITVPNGDKYYFGRTLSTTDTDPIETTDPYSSQSGFVTGTSISSWYLNKIETADGTNSISLNYEQEEYGVFNLITSPVSQGDPSNPNGITCSKNIIHGVRLKQIVFSNGSVDFVPGSMRQDLSTPNQDNASDNGIHTAYTLAQIKVKSTNAVLKNFNFDYDYFEDNSTMLSTSIPYNITTDKKRLKLKKVYESDGTNSSNIPPHEFTYFAEQVPRRLSCGQDHWGFANGENNNGLIPTYTISKYFEYLRAKRDAAWPAMRAGTINKITYPTGGNTEFEFEAHSTPVSYTKYNSNYLSSFSTGYDGNQNTQNFSVSFNTTVHKFMIANDAIGGNAYFTTPQGATTIAPGTTVPVIIESPPGTFTVSLSKPNASTGHGCAVTYYDMVPIPVQENALVGGLRIKKISSINLTTAINKITNYSYLDNAQKSTGILYSRPIYIQALRNDILGEVGLGGGAGSYPNNVETPYGCPNIGPPIFIVSGSSTRPLDVTQGGHIGYNQVKVSEVNNGFKIYRYYGSNYWDNIIGDVCVRDMSQGLCSFAIPNTPAADLPHEYKRGELKYEGSFNENGQVINSTDYYVTFEENLMVTPCVKSEAFAGTWQNTFFNLKTSKKKEAKSIAFSFDNNGNSITTTTTTYFESLFHNQPTRIVTADSKGFASEQKIKSTYDYTNSCDVISTANQEYNTNFNSTTSQYQFSLLNDNSSNSRRTKWQNYQASLNSIRSAHVTRLLNESTSFSTCLLNSKNNADVSLKPILDLRSRFINLPIETSTWKNGNLLSSTFTKYDYVTNPPIFPYPSKIQSIKLATPTTIFTPSVVSGNTITKDSRYVDEAALKFDNGNVVETVGKDGITTSYIWGYNNTLPIVKATGVSYTTLKAAYDAVAGNLTTIRTQPSLSTAFINTYFYIAGVGMTSETDPNGHSKYYEYDNLNRLSLIRDQDNNILKKICYNYAGQVEDCSSPCPPNSQPNWQNTSAVPTCEQVGCGFTGNQLQQQMDMNTCSPTSGTTRVIQVANPTACPATALATITYQNTTGSSGFVATYTHRTTGQVTTFAIPSSSSGVLGCLPSGPYSLGIARPGVQSYYVFGSGTNCFTQSGSSAYFGKVNVPNCSHVTIDWEQ
jgi:hypothetical protein